MGNEIKIRLQGHEKFPLREGWLNKGIKAVKNNPMVFQKNGTDILGVGTNMVKSIRFWLNAFQLIKESPKNGAVLTELGEIIYKYDKNIIDDFTLWLLHMNLICNNREATSWYLFFNRCDINEFDKKTLFNHMKRELIKYTGNDNFSENSLNSDIDVLFSMYSKNKNVGDPEDKNTSPFSRLGLLQKMGDIVYKTQPDIRKINEWVVLEIIARFLENDISVSIDTAIMSENGVARITQLGIIAINDILDKLDMIGCIRINRTAGLDMIYRVENYNYDSVAIAEQYYTNRE
ncbi:DUF4007 family protein [Lachnospira eligens]|jgi:hypothetical protein|uniref:DUF4007 family protein n=1 Tax=Lachnospira eligens TaxID=39485 RepID=A0A414DIF8_9FIRM|nr:DUF4007 family protein [Lachnospira eligens]RHD10824.1 DUF4007 family protein [Lachnospira eligens]